MVSYYCCYSYWKLSESQTEFLFEMRPGEFYLWLALSDCCKFCLVERPMVLARKLWFNRWSGFTIFALSRYANWHKSQQKELHLINYEWMHEWKRYICYVLSANSWFNFAVSSQVSRRSAALKARRSRAYFLYMSGLFKNCVRSLMSVEKALPAEEFSFLCYYLY